MSETTVQNDVAARHVLVAAEPFMAMSRAGFFVPVQKGAVLAVQMLGQTNVHAGQGPAHVERGGKRVTTLIEHATAKPATAHAAGDVLTDDEVAAGIATAAAKQALVPGQIAAREKQAQAARAVHAEAQAAIPRRLAALEAEIVALKGAKPAA